MDKLHVFSEKLGMSIEIGTSAVCCSTTNNATCFEGWTNGGWSNYSDSWLNGGWNNYSDGWMNEGWSNYSSSWTNNGWNNYSDSWTNSGWTNGK